MTKRITPPASKKNLYGIIGFPLGHTMSPPLHNWGFGEIGFAGEYRVFPVEPAELAEFMDIVRELPVSGLSVTIPHKVAVMEFVDGVSDRAKAVGAVNTLYWDKDRLMGENTDIHGFLAPLRQLPQAPGSALVLGAGGAARAAVAGLVELGVGDVAVCNRSWEKAEALAKEFKVATVAWEDRDACGAELVVNSTPLGMLGDRVDMTPWPDEACMSPNQIAYDLVYNPQETVFLRRAAARGCRIVDGLSMFVHQAVEQFRLWTGQQFDVDQARLLIADLLAGNE